MDNELAPPQRKLNKKQLASLAAFTDPAAILSQLAKNGWTIEESIASLVSIAKEADKASVQLNAIKYLNQLTIDAMSRAGMIVTASRSLGSGGDVTRFTGHMVSKSLKSQKEGESDETDIEDLLLPTKETLKQEKQNDNQDNQETKKEETEEIEEEDNKEDAGNDIDMSICKPPEGDHHEGGHFDGISSAGAPSTITLL